MSTEINNREDDHSNQYNDLKDNRHVAVNCPYFFNARDILLVSLELEEDPHDEIWDHEDEQDTLQ